MKTTWFSLLVLLTAVVPAREIQGNELMQPQHAAAYLMDELCGEQYVEIAFHEDPTQTEIVALVQAAQSLKAIQKYVSRSSRVVGVNTARRQGRRGLKSRTSEKVIEQELAGIITPMRLNALLGTLETNRFRNIVVTQATMRTHLSRDDTQASVTFLMGLKEHGFPKSLVDESRWSYLEFDGPLSSCALDFIKTIPNDGEMHSNFNVIVSIEDHNDACRDRSFVWVTLSATASANGIGALKSLLLALGQSPTHQREQASWQTSVEPGNREDMPWLFDDELFAHRNEELLGDYQAVMPIFDK